jgi:SET domain-containing protein
MGITRRSPITAKARPERVAPSTTARGKAQLKTSKRRVLRSPRNQDLAVASKTTEYSFILRPSTIHGIGVFCTHDIKKGTPLRLFVPEEKDRVLPAIEHPAFEQYCFDTPRGTHGPADFGRMSVGWFLNHSHAPNAFHKNYVYFAARDIKAEEEITIDYDSLGE